MHNFRKLTSHCFVARVQRYASKVLSNSAVLVATFDMDFVAIIATVFMDTTVFVATVSMDSSVCVAIFVYCLLLPSRAWMEPCSKSS